MKHSVSIIICTRNRAGSLKLTLDSIARAGVPAGLSMELLVMDNGSTDDTEQVVRNATFPKLTAKYVREPRVGKSYAYNAAVAVAEGEILLCADDDVRVPLNWIAGMCQPLLEGKADAVAGGVIFPPQIELVLDSSLIKDCRGWVASTHELDPAHPTRMVGANMAFHRRVLDKVPQFDVELGPGPEGLGNFEDTLFSWQIAAAGYKIIGALEVAVEHHFDTSRLTGDILLEAARKMGRSQAFVFHHWQHQKSRLIFLWLVLEHLRYHWMRVCGRKISKTNNHASNRILHLEKDLAFTHEYLVQRRRSFKYPARALTPQVLQNKA